jgi:mono/diheme cytochrome c family protein
MKNCAFAFALFAVNLLSSLTLAQNQIKSDVSGLGSHDHSELNKAPEKARARVNPFQNDPDAVSAGQILFEDHCLECHGPVAVERKKGPDLLGSDVRNATAGTLFWLLTNGVARKGMPVWSKLPEAQRWQLVRYLKSLEVKDGFKNGPQPLARR